MPADKFKITSWINTTDEKLHKSGYIGHIQYLTNLQWLEREKEKFRKRGIGTEIKTNPENHSEQALFYISVDDLPHIETPQERYRSIKNTYQ